ncbi:MAG TPA: cation diffusion facilitator family transporter [Hyphomicrobiaceae bacterium]|jgi:cobalt-zinc-cadmium efflux system protein|nr:cation diffusion facilitator family transporter [Hyphomicrobiaceae bacterium]
MGAHHAHADSHAGPPGHAHNERAIGWAALLTGGFLVVEVIGGLLAGSLALLADAGHMLTDAASLGLAWAAFRIGRRPHDWQRTYGFHRFQVLAAFTNGLSLVFIALAIVYEAVSRLYAPVEVLGRPMLLVAAIGLAINIASFLILHAAGRHNLNVRGAMLHVLGDLAGSIAAIVAAVVILWSGWTPIDPLLSVLVAALIVVSAWSLLRESGHILLEGVPRGLDVRALRDDLMQVAGVEDVHHVHAWSINQERPMVTMHVRVADPALSARVLGAVKARLLARHNIDHATVEIECEACADDAAAQAPHAH